MLPGPTPHHTDRPSIRLLRSEPQCQADSPQSRAKQELSLDHPAGFPRIECHGLRQHREQFHRLEVFADAFEAKTKRGAHPLRWEARRLNLAPEQLVLVAVGGRVRELESLAVAGRLLDRELVAGGARVGGASHDQVRDFEANNT